MRSKVPLFLLVPLLCVAQEVLPTEDGACTLFGPQRERILEAGKYGRRAGRLSDLTAQVMGRLGDVRSFVPGGSRTNSQLQLDQFWSRKLPEGREHVAWALTEQRRKHGLVLTA